MPRFHDPTQVRTLHRLVLPARCHDPGDAPVRRGVVSRFISWEHPAI